MRNVYRIRPRRLATPLAIVLSLALIPTVSLPVVAAAATVSAPTTADKLHALPSDKTTTIKPQVPTGNFANPPAAGPAQQPTSPGDHYKPGVSKLVKQTATSNVYDNGDNTESADIAASPINYQDGNGAWHAIDNTIKSDGAGRLVNTAGPYTASLATTTGTGGLADLVSNGTTLGFDLNGLTSGINGVISTNSVTFPGAVNGGDLTYYVSSSALKEVIKLNSPPSSAAPVTYTFPLNSLGLTAKTQNDGSIVFVDSSGKTQFSIPQGTMADSSPSAPLDNGNGPNPF